MSPTGSDVATESQVEDGSISAFHPQVGSICETEGCLNKNTHSALNGDRSCTSCPAQSENADLPPRWCLWLGMTIVAWQGWRKLHIHPLVAVCYYFSANAGLHIAAIWILSGMAAFRGIYLYISTFTFLGFIALGILTDLIFWRCGPDVANHKLFPAAVALSEALLLPTIILACLGPMDAVPFQNRVYFICLASFGVFCHSHAIAAGGTKGEQPLHPRTSLFRPFMRANFRALQLVDGVTDVAVISSLLAQKRSGCWWFGEEGNCQAWNRLIAAFSSFWCVKFTLTLGVMLSGGESSGKSRRMQRLVFASDVTALVCEVGVVCCTLLEIFSLRVSGVHGSFGERELKTQMALGVVSLIATFASLVIMLMGASVALKVVYNVWSRVQATTGLSRRSSGRSSAPPRSSHVAPIKRSTDEKFSVCDTSSEYFAGGQLEKESNVVEA